MSKMTVKAAMVPQNDLAAAQAALEAAVAEARLGEPVSMLLALMFPAGVDSAATNMGTLADGAATWTPLSLGAHDWTFTATDTGVTASFTVTARIETPTYVAPAISATLGPVSAGQTVGGGDADVPIRVEMLEPGDPPRSPTDVALSLTVDGAPAPLPHLARTGETLVASAALSHPAGDVSASSAGVIVSPALVAPMFRTAPAIDPAVLATGAPVTLSLGSATGYPVPMLSGVLTLDGVDVTARIEGANYLPESAGEMVWTVTAANGVAPPAMAQVSRTVCPAIAEAPSPSRIADVMPATLAAGAPISPSALGTPARNGPNIVTNPTCPLVNGGRVSGVTFVGGDDGYLQFSVSAGTFPVNNIHTFEWAPTGLPVGATLIFEVLSASNSMPVFKVVNGAQTTLSGNLLAGGSLEYTVESGFEKFRHSLYYEGAYRVRVRVKNAVPAVPEVPGTPVNLNACFVGGTGSRAITISGLPAGLSATAGVIEASQTPAIGSGGRYDVAVTATDEAGVALALTAPLEIVEPFAVESVSIRNLAGDAVPLRAGDTAEMAVAHRGWPGPYPSNSADYPQWRRVWRDQSNAVIGSGPTIVVPAGATELRASARFQTDAGGALTPEVIAAPTPVSGTVTEAPTIPTVTAQTSATVSGYEVTIDYGAAQGAPTPTPDLIALTVDGVEVLAPPAPEWSPVESWTSTDAVRDNAPETIQGFYGGFAFAGPNHWGNWALDGAGASIETRFESAGALRRMRTITTGAVDAPDYTPIGAPHVTFGRHYNLVSNTNPFGSHTDSATMTEWKARARYTVNSASAGARMWPAVQLYGWRQDNAAAGSTDFTGTLDLDLQIRYVNDPTGYLGTVAYTTTIGGRNWRVNTGSIFSKARIYTYAPPIGEDFYEFTDLDLLAIVNEVVAKENARLGTSFTGFRFAACQFWVEPLHGTSDVTLDRIGMRLNGVSYGEF